MFSTQDVRDETDINNNWIRYFTTHDCSRKWISNTVSCKRKSARNLVDVE